MGTLNPSLDSTVQNPGGAPKEKAFTEGVSETAEDKNPFFAEELYGRNVEIATLNDLTPQRGTGIPALFNAFYKFIQNPSTISVETFKRMVDTDDTLGSGIEFLTTALAARLGQYQHPVPEIADYVNKRLEEIDGGWTTAIKEILSATWAGFSVTEKVWANTENGFVPKRLVTLPPQTILFEVERTGELTKDGILQYQRNFNPIALSYGVGFFGATITGFGSLGAHQPDPFAALGDLPYPIRTANSFSYLSIRIPTRKCIHYSFSGPGKFGNPYGRSLLRRAYKYWVMKDAFLKMMATALDRKGTPLTVVWADPNQPLKDNTKTPAANQRGKAVAVNPITAAADAFKNVHNDSVIVLPGKKDQAFSVEAITQGAAVADFQAAIGMCDRGMLRALLIPSLIFSNGDGTGSFSLGQEHAKTWEKILDGWLAPLSYILLQDIIKEMLAYNFPKHLWEKEGLGSFYKRDLTQEERQKEAEILDKAITMGAVDMADINDLNTVREKVGFEPRQTIIQKPEPIPMWDPVTGQIIQPDQGGSPQLDENGEPIPPPAEGEAQPAQAGGFTPPPGSERVTQDTDPQPPGKTKGAPENGKGKRPSFLARIFYR